MKSAANFTDSKNFRNLASRLFDDAAQREEFCVTLASGKANSPALIWLNGDQINSPFDSKPRTSWQPDFVQALEPDALAGSHPLHEKGSFYCLDMSSVFQAASAQAVAGLVHTALDLCASPGGKSIFLHRLYQPEFLVSNEVIRKRLGALLSNLTRCKAHSVVVCADVSKLADAIGGSIDLVFVDAPCSGQSLIARGKKAPSCFHPATINMNSNRQKRIIANAGTISRPGGYLVYSTCTFSIEENEAVIEWFCRRFPQFETVEQEILKSYRSRYTESFCYRLFPQQGEGAGGFTCLLVNKGDEESNNFEPSSLERFLVRETGVV